MRGKKIGYCVGGGDLYSFQENMLLMCLYSCLFYIMFNKHRKKKQKKTNKNKQGGRVQRNENIKITTKRFSNCFFPTAIVQKYFFCLVFVYSLRIHHLKFQFTIEIFKKKLAQNKDGVVFEIEYDKNVNFSKLGTLYAPGNS